MRITCPSGLTIDIRKLHVREANILSDAQAAKKGVQMDKLLASITQEVHDPGPYRFAGTPIWSEVLSGDRFYTHLMARVATHGPEYDFNIPCHHCRAPIKWTLDLTTDLKFQPLSDASRKTFVEGNHFSAKGPDGLTYQFHLQTGKGERRAQQFLERTRSEPITAGLVSRIDAIEGLESVEDMVAYLESMPLADVLDLTAALDEHECGVDTEVSVLCSACGGEMEVELPLARKEFWAPKRKSQKVLSQLLKAT